MSSEKSLEDKRLEIKGWMKKARINQFTLAESVGCSQGHLSKLLSGKVNADTPIFKEICIRASIENGEAQDYDPISDSNLINSIRKVVGHNPKKAKKLSLVIRALRTAL